MATEIIVLIIFIVLAIIGVVEFFVFQKNREDRKNLIEREEDTRNRLYEITILNELSDKMGYSLGVQNVIEVIIKSLPDFIDYTTVAYMILNPQRISHFIAE